ncbi:hypothetical protein THAOC_01898 [Thalassiosira oceanica]|uniref:Uncharacterized protein n=1 Tax=Thalassiosira oceanica TaxID=159749 RepID=K0TC96_THAOC|nr:hypothetical protein THAOC_01898 [Thalassiosira oceanica]|mmetsp:Transcript_31842/g.76048  ORF Transcript_31842/g.76048 Transcript_31842/m.76048 type:complete len:346 (+) Transcript_31842:62-1099(+)|eukprot:EJK76343.1 hypothetical protein THAOC_01898 [Thalassiosira oceanica]
MAGKCHSLIFLLLVSAAWHLVLAGEASRHSSRRLVATQRGSRRQVDFSGSAQKHGGPDKVGVSDSRGLLISRRRSLEDVNDYADDQYVEGNDYADDQYVEGNNYADEQVEDEEEEADDAVEDEEYADDANNNNYGQDNWWEEEIAANTDDDYYNDGASENWSQVTRSFHNAEDRAWQYYDAPPSQWTAAQWDLMCALVGGLLVFCCGLSAVCAYCCITQGDPLAYGDPRSPMSYGEPMSPMSVGSETSVDGRSMGQRTRKFWADKTRRLRARGNDYSAYRDGNDSYVPPLTPSDPMLAKLDYDTVRRKDEEAQEKARKKLEMEKMKEDKLLEARAKDNFVGYYVS